MIELQQAQAIATQWIEAWNAHDLEEILTHYAEELEFVSPLVVSRLGRDDGTIRTRTELRAYFEPSLGKESTLRFELIDVMAGVSSLTLVYRNHRELIVAETMFVDTNGLAKRVYVHHRPG